MSLGKSQTKNCHYEEAMSLYKKGLYARSAAILERLIGSNDLRGHLARFYHARACRLEAERRLAEGEYSSATDYLQCAMKYNSQSCELIEYLAESYVRSEEYCFAGEEYGRLAELNPEKPQSRIKEAMSYFLAGQGKRAIAILEPMVAENPSHFETNYYLGTILAAEDKANRSIGYLNKACQLRPEHMEARWKLGLAKGLAGHLMEAIHHLQLAHKLEPGNHWLLTQLTLAVGQARSQGIEVEVELASKTETQSASSNRAIEQLGELIIREPEFVTAFLDLPTTEVDEQIFSSLLDILMRTLERNPEYADLHYHCSRVYERLGRSDQAIRASERALAINPRYVGALIHLAKMYAQTSQDQEAITRFKEAIRLGADYADVHYLLGKLYHDQGSLVEARRHYKEALRINGKFHAAKEALALIAA